MATPTGSTTTAVEERLLAHGERFSYFQAVRLLRLFAKARGLPAESLRVRPKLSLGFPDSDIDCIEKQAGGGYRITANFFSLYGVASPLPTYYTEDIVEEEREGRRATRDFLDVIHYVTYPLLFEAWRKHRLQERVVEDADAAGLDQIYAFTGLHERKVRQSLPEGAGLLRYAGLFSQHPRSALGLHTLLSDAFSPALVGVDSCSVRSQAIPVDQRLLLGVQGNQLGEEAYLGAEIDDYCGGLTIRLDKLPASLFLQLLPGAAGYKKLKFLIRFYLVAPLHVKVELRPLEGDVFPARTASCAKPQSTSGIGMHGGHLATSTWSRLGLDTWLMPGRGQPPAAVEFVL